MDEMNREVNEQISNTLHLLYSEYGNDITGVDVEYDKVSKVLVVAAIKLHTPLNNRSELMLFIHHRGDPHKTAPDMVIMNVYKGEGVGITNEEGGCRYVINGHLAGADPAPHPPGTRLTTLETDVIPSIFV